MLRPSYSDLLEVLNRDNEDATIGSRYTIVIAAAKRARQLVDNAEPLTNNVRIDKPVSIAVQEMFEGKIKVREREVSDTDRIDALDCETKADMMEGQTQE